MLSVFFHQEVQSAPGSTRYTMVYGTLANNTPSSFMGMTGLPLHTLYWLYFLLDPTNIRYVINGSLSLVYTPVFSLFLLHWWPVISGAFLSGGGLLIVHLVYSG